MADGDRWRHGEVKGSGTITGGPAPTDDPFKFQVWADDNDPDPDTLRIKIWYGDGGNEAVVHDNGMNQPIGVWDIKVHDK